VSAEFAEMLAKAQAKLAKQNGAAEPRIRYYTARELATLTSPEPDWLVRGFLALELITELDGKIKRAGKTTWWLALVRKVLDGEPFMGYQTRKARVIYLTEQSSQTFTDALRRAGLADCGPELWIVFRRDMADLPWPAVIAKVEADALAGGYELIVVDTIGKLAGIRNENDAGEWSAAMTPLQDATHDGLAIGVARHDRKGGGEVTESGRGSSQGSGDVDIVLQLRRPEGNQPTNRRVLESGSRYPDTPDKIVIELSDAGSYLLLGEEEAVATADAKLFLSGAIGGSSAGNETGATREQLVTLGKDQEPVVSEWSIRQGLDALVADGILERLGEGKRGSPYTYRQRESFLSGVTQNSKHQIETESKLEVLQQVLDITGGELVREGAE
jgi:hypothetical protein